MSTQVVIEHPYVIFCLTTVSLDKECLVNLPDIMSLFLHYAASDNYIPSNNSLFGDEVIMTSIMRYIFLLKFMAYLEDS